MMIPSFLYGPYSKVKGVCRRKAKELKRGAGFADLPAGQWLDTATTPGTIVVDGPSRSFSHQTEQFCCFALAVAISDEWDGVPWAEQRDTIWAAYHEAAMLESWLFLGLLERCFAEPGTGSANFRPQARRSGCTRVLLRFKHRYRSVEQSLPHPAPRMAGTVRARRRGVLAPARGRGSAVHKGASAQGSVDSSHQHQLRPRASRRTAGEI